MNRLAVCGSVAVAVLCSVLMTGCGGSMPMTKANFDKIKEGMTIEEVSAVMGFPPPNWDKSSIVPGAGIMDTKNGVDRETKTDLDGFTYDHFHYKEMGGTNKKDIHVRYFDGKVQSKEEVGLQ